MAAMSPAEFVAYCNGGEEPGAIYYLEEFIAEADAQYRNECAMFGDAGPGQGLRLSEARAELARMKRARESALRILARRG